MENLIETIRAAVAADANDETKAAGLSACRTILAALETKAGEPLATATPATNPLAGIVTMLRGMQPEQLLDLAIARLRAALPADARHPPIAGPKFLLPQLLPGVKP